MLPLASVVTPMVVEMVDVPAANWLMALPGAIWIDPVPPIVVPAIGSTWIVLAAVVPTFRTPVIVEAEPVEPKFTYELPRVLSSVTDPADSVIDPTELLNGDRVRLPDPSLVRAPVPLARPLNVRLLDPVSTVLAALTVTALAEVNAVVTWSSPPLRVIPPVPRSASAATCTVPPPMVVPPEYVFGTLRTSVPAPVLVSPVEPLMAPPEKVYVPLVLVTETADGLTPAAWTTTGPTPALPNVTEFPSA